MSHFSCLVIGADHEGALQPFQENNMGDCPRQYMQFNDMEDEYDEEYETDTATRVVMPDGSFKCTWDDEFRIPGSFGIGSDTHRVPSHLPQREVPFKELYASFDDFATNYHGAKRDEEKGRYGYWENQNKKWDWYEVGGRWPNKLLFKDGTRGSEGKVGDMDLDGMLATENAKAASLFDSVTAAIAGREVQSWAKVLQRHDAGEFTIETARAFYNGQEVVKDLIASKVIDSWNGADQLSGVLAAKDRANYIEREAQVNSTTWALLHNGHWAERGSMGWFGVSDTTADKTLDYAVNFWLTLRSLAPGEIVTVVDCHI